MSMTSVMGFEQVCGCKFLYNLPMRPCQDTSPFFASKHSAKFTLNLLHQAYWIFILAIDHVAIAPCLLSMSSRSNGLGQGTEQHFCTRDPCHASSPLPEARGFSPPGFVVVLGLRADEVGQRNASRVALDVGHLLRHPVRGPLHSRKYRTRP